MTLTSKFFRDDTRLKSCAINDTAHVTKGSVGQHVRLIQDALEMIDGALIADGEKAQSRYGDTTAEAVLAYKRKRKIINKAYQNKEDDIVGKMTIASLDKDIKDLEEPFEPVESRPFTICTQITPINLVKATPIAALQPQVGRKIANEVFGSPNPVVA